MALTGSSALYTDHYELTMLQAALAAGTAARRCTFEVQARRLPAGRRYGVAAGQGRLVEALSRFEFGPGERAALAAGGVVDAATLEFLAGYRFGGDIDALAEGEVYLPGEPVALISGSFAECVVLETLVLSVLNHDSAVAAGAARMVTAAVGRPLLEMGARRTHEGAAVASARVAYLCGFAATSNLAAGERWGIPTSGTSGHAFTLLHDSERAAFTAQVAALGPGTTLLVDTYDVPAAVRTAVEVAGPSLGAVRLDSGDLAEVAVAVRAQLDSLGATGTKIVVTSDLDEYSIAALSGAPVDVYGVGTALVTGSGQPTAGFVYKMVECQGAPVSKLSPGKSGRGGRRDVVRQLDAAGVAVADLVSPVSPVSPAPSAGGRPAGASSASASPPSASSASASPPSAPPVAARTRALLQPLLRAGEPVDPVLSDPASPAALAAARAHHRRAMAELPPAARALSYGDPAIPVLAI